MLSHIPAFTSTGSKRPDVLFGTADGVPVRMTRASGCRIWDDQGREYVDYIMGLGAVALGYGHPAVTRAAVAAVEAGVVGPLAPVLEEELAAELARLIPWAERSRFLKTGAEAVAAAVRLARVATGRDRILGCGYHGWLDWCQRAEGVPAATRALYDELPFNDPERSRAMIRAAGDQLAAVVIEPLVVREPDPAWLAVVREETRRLGALLIVDEIKAVCRLAVGGGSERYGIEPDLVVLGKAIANGFPLAVVAGRAEVMMLAERTWISSTLATELVALAAARATLDVVVAQDVPRRIEQVGGRLFAGLLRLRERYPATVAGVRGVPAMCFLDYADDGISQTVARECARRGVLFKRAAYNFPSLAHDDGVIDRTLAILDEVLAEIRR